MYIIQLMDAITTPFVYSRRLTSLTAHIVFVTLVSFEASSVLVSAFDQPLIRFVYLPILPFYLIGGIYGWQWTQRHGRYVGAYFVLMTLLGLIGAVVASLVLGEMLGMLSTLMLIMQAAVLVRWQRICFIGAIVCAIVIMGLMTESAFALRIWLTQLSATSAVLAFSFFGDVIVSEEKARTQLARYAEQVEELAATRERNRIAREIHDNLGHYLTAINMQAQAAQAILLTNPIGVNTALSHIQTLTREGLQEVRKSITTLRELTLERYTLYEAIEALLIESRTRGLAVDFQILGITPPRHTEIDMTLYRVIQEALTNIHRHAEASCVHIRLSYQDVALIRLHICDDGKGTSAPQEGFGLLGLRERVHLLGGSLKTHSAQGEGFCMEVEIPR